MADDRPPVPNLALLFPLVHRALLSEDPKQAPHDWQPGCQENGWPDLAVGRRTGDADDRRVQRLASHRAEERGIAMTEDAAVGGHLAVSRAS